MKDIGFKVFREVEEAAIKWVASWDIFRDDVQQCLDRSSDGTVHPELAVITDSLHLALTDLLEKLRNPVLTLATTGTTSGGKSTIVNFLCGAKILPVDIHEITAGVTTIEYNEEKSLIIHETDDAPWECGRWQNLSDDEIYSLLKKVMEKYLEKRKENFHLHPPEITVYYPIRMIKESWLNFPPGIKIKIIDLPGLSSINDSKNSEIIQSFCKEALSIVTYNAAEVDRHKVDTLLRQVVSQVKDLGGSPARMLFVLNRIDMLDGDDNPIEKKAKHVEFITNSIKEVLKENLQEYTEDIEQIKVICLSSKAALTSLQIQSTKNQDKITKICDDALADFMRLIAKNILRDAGIITEEWSDRDRERVAESLWKNSNASQFEEALKQHINTHFPKLVIPQAIKKFYQVAYESAIRWSLDTTNAIINTTEKKYEKECERIEFIRICLIKFLNESNQGLKEPFDKLESRFKEIKNLTKEEIEKLYQTENYKDLILDFEIDISSVSDQIPFSHLVAEELLNAEKLHPLYGWRSQLAIAFNKSLDVIEKCLLSNEFNLEKDEYFNQINPDDLKQLEGTLKSLHRFGYTKYATHGGEFKAKTEEDKVKLKDINLFLNNLSANLNKILPEVLSNVLRHESERIYESFDILLKAYLSYLEKETQKIAPEYRIRFPENQILIEAKPSLEFKFNFESGYLIIEKEEKEPIETIIKKRSFLYFLWIIPKEEKKTKFENRKFDNANIPSASAIKSNWKLQKDVFDIDVTTKVLSFFMDQLRNFENVMDKYINHILDNYQAKLNQAQINVNESFARDLEIWNSFCTKAAELDLESANLLKIVDKESRNDEF